MKGQAQKEARYIKIALEINKEKKSRREKPIRGQP
jgi:hypothetical protein